MSTEALDRSLEWSGPDETCPRCHWHRRHGAHRMSCPYANAYSAPTQPAPPASEARRRRVVEALARLVLAAQAADRADRSEQAKDSEIA